MTRIPIQRPIVVARNALLVCILLACCPCVFALNPALDVSQYAHTAWKIRDGFTKGKITSIAQTPDGYLWLGTEFGLYRFDGVRAVPWQPPNGDRLPSNTVGSLLVGRDGTLWIGTLKGLATWKDGKLTQYPDVVGQILSLFQDHEGTVWFEMLAPGRLCAIQGEKPQCYGAGSFGHWAAHLFEDHNDNLWVSSQTGLWRWAPGTPKHYMFPGGEVRVTSVIEDDQGALLLATNAGLKQLVHGEIQNYALPGVTAQVMPSCFFRSSDGSLWVGTVAQGLQHLHQGRTDTFESTEGFSGDYVTQIFEDREGSVWVMTTSGLDRFREYSFATISRDQGLSNSAVYAVQATPDGSIWIGGANELNRWENGHVTVYGKRSAPSRIGASGEQRLNVTGAVTEIPNSGLAGTIASLGLDDRGRLWVSTNDGVFYFEGEQFVRVPGIPGGNIWSIAGHGHGEIWISRGTEGLSHLGPADAVQSIPWARFGQKNSGARALLPDPTQGGVWLGFYDGGVAYFKDGQIRASYTATDGLGDGRVNDLRFGSRGTLWASTEGGLSRIRDGHVATLTSKNGLPCNEVHWSAEDDDHFVWVYMPCGLLRVARSELDAWVSDSKRKLNLTTFDNSDGVASVGVYSSWGPRVTKSPDGRIWFVHNEGVTVIDPHHLPFNKLPPPVHIEQITADRISHDVTTDANGQLSLPALSRDLEIDYTALSLVNPEKIRFRYKLEGYDRDWQDVGNRRQAFYTNLPPRNYRFRVMACNNSGVWNETGTYFDFAIAPAYYQTTWFRVLVVIGFLSLIAAIYQLRVRQVARQVRGRMEERLQERERIARDLHDTLLQSVQGLILKFDAGTKKIPRSEPAREDLEKTLDHADEVLAEGRDRLRNLRANTIPYGGLPAAFEQVAEENSQDGNVTFKTVVEGQVLELHPMVREEAFCIGREAIVNALTHSSGRRVEVEIIYDSRQFRLRVRDDGRGIDPKILAKGGRDNHWGMRGMRERAERISAQLELWSGPSTGTEVELRVPAAAAYRDHRAGSWRNWFRRSDRAGEKQQERTEQPEGLQRK